ncbi:hypothetical protein WA158_001743 [Blastocystis sp. Blastoise]
MPTSDFQLTEDKYLFTFQDETKLWIPKEFIEKYQQLPFYDIIKHSEKYEDGSYYIDMPSLSMKSVIDFLMEENMDIDSLNLRDSYDIYKTLIEYSITINNVIQSDLLFHVKELFYKYLEDNNFDVSGYYCEDKESRIPMELYNLEKKEIRVNNLFMPKRKDELLYYSLLIKMMNVAQVRITYDYASNIPLEYICPSCIKDIFPSLKELYIAVNTHYKKTEQLLNPNSDEYIMEYHRLFGKYYFKVNNPEHYEYYTESDMNEYNKLVSIINNNLNYLHNFIDPYNGKRQKTEYPKLYKYVVNEAIYTNDYLNVEINEIKDEYILDDIVSIKYDDKANDKSFCIDRVSSKHGISQLLCLPSFYSVSQIKLGKYCYSKRDTKMIMKYFEEVVFDSLTILSVKLIKEMTRIIDDNMFMSVITTHVFPNVTELIYDDEDNDELFNLSSLTKKCFPKLHIINYKTEINTNNYQSLFPVNIISMIDTIQIDRIGYTLKEEIAIRIDELAYTHSIHIDKFSIDGSDCIYNFPHLKELLEKDLISMHRLFVDSGDSENVAKLDYLKDSKQNIDELIFAFNNNEYNDDTKISLERFIKSDVLQHLNKLTINFFGIIIDIDLMWISTLFNDNKFNSIHELTIDLQYFKEDLPLEYITILENLMEKLISKVSVVTLQYCYITFINRLIPKGCFHNTTQLNLDIEDIPNDNFCKLYTTDNFPKLKSIKICKNGQDGKVWWLDFIKIFYYYSYDEYIYNSFDSIFRCKYDSNSFMNTIIGNKDIYEESQLLNLINVITIGKIPKLKYISFICYDISYEQIETYKQQLKDSAFIQGNHVNYLFD